MSDVNANVTLSLHELDKLRNQVKENDKKLHDQAVEIAKMKAQAPQIKVTITQITPYTSHERIDSYSIRDRDYRYYPYDLGSPPEPPKFKQVQLQHIASNIEYLNLDDVRDTLRIEAEDKVSDELITMRNKLTLMHQDKIKYESDFYKEKSNLEIKHKDEVKRLTSSYENEIDSLKNVIKVMREEEVVKTKDQLLIDLKNQITKLQNRTLFNYIFS